MTMASCSPSAHTTQTLYWISICRPTDILEASSSWKIAKACQIENFVEGEDKNSALWLVIHKLSFILDVLSTFVLECWRLSPSLIIGGPQLESIYWRLIWCTCRLYLLDTYRRLRAGAVRSPALGALASLDHSTATIGSLCVTFTVCLRLGVSQGKS